MKNFSAFIFVFFLLPGILIAQESAPKKLTHWLTPEEESQRGDLGRNFVETPPPAGPIRNIAEFDRMQGALVRYPFGIPITLIKEMAEDVEVTTIVASTAQQNTVLQQYISNGVDTSHCTFLIAPSDSYWTRDYGPWFVSDSSKQIGIVDFPYNRPRPNDDEIPKKVADMLGIPWYGMNVIHTGGNYMTDGLGSSSSTQLVYVENPTQTAQQIADKFSAYLGVTNYMVVEDPNNTYIDHIDCWGKYLAPDKILIRRVPPTHPQYDTLEATAAFYASTPCSYGYNYRVFRVSTPSNQPYSNSVILNNKVLFPKMGTNYDDSAKAAYQAAMPGYEVIGFTGNPSTPWESTDALHCRVMGIADLNQLYIKHIPLTGNQPAQDNFFLQADLLASSQAGVNPDSVLIHFNVNNGVWHTITMTGTGTHFTGYIPKQPAGSIIRYYLTGADQLNNRASCPFMGAADPFKFTAIYTDLTAIPDTLRFLTYEDCMDGKFTAIKNLTSGTINLNSIQDFGWFTPGPTGWSIIDNPVTNYPHAMAPNDSVRFRVIILIITENPIMGYWIDSLEYSSPTGNHRIILLLNDTLVFGGMHDRPGIAGPLRMQIYPNPASSNTTISFRLEKEGAVQIDLYDMQGRAVRTLVRKQFPAGIQTVGWDLRNENGTRVNNGMYLIRLTSGTATVWGKVLVE